MTSRRSSTGAADDPDIFAEPVHLFAADRFRAVSQNPDPALLPPSPDGVPWRNEGVVPLGVQRVELPGTEPEPVITGLLAHGYYLWSISTDEDVAL